VITGFLLNRLNVSITGIEGWAGGHYFPRWTEAAASLATVAAAVFGFALAVRYLSVFPKMTSPEKQDARPEPALGVRYEVPPPAPSSAPEPTR